MGDSVSLVQMEINHELQKWVENSVRNVDLVASQFEMAHCSIERIALFVDLK